jgi:REP element-mobilizing transposase RayT
MYHVYCRTSRGEPIFADRAATERFLEILRQVRRRDGLTVFAWCVMSNHYHLAVRTGRVPLWRSMRLVQGRFAVAHNRRSRQFGPVWQGRYKARLIEDQGYFEQLVAYIHLNPVAAGVVKEASRYRWSGHNELLGRRTEGLVDVDETLRLFGSRRGEARQAYLRVLRSRGERPWLEQEPGRLPWWGGEGSDELLEADAGRPKLDAQGVSSGPARPRLSAAHYLAVASKALRIAASDLGGRHKGRDTTQAREALVVVGVEVFGVRVNDLARQLRMNPGSVSRVLVRAGERRADSGEFVCACERLERAVARAGS